MSPISIPLTSSSMLVGHLHRQRLDVDLARDLRERAALAHAGRVLGADELNVDGRRDRLVEPHLVQVDVHELPAQRILLVVLEDRRRRAVPPSSTTSRIVCMPPPPVSALRSSRSGTRDRVRLLPLP